MQDKLEVFFLSGTIRYVKVWVIGNGMTKEDLFEKRDYFLYLEGVGREKRKEG